MQFTFWSYLGILSLKLFAVSRTWDTNDVLDLSYLYSSILLFWGFFSVFKTTMIDGTDAAAILCLMVTAGCAIVISVPTGYITRHHCMAVMYCMYLLTRHHSGPILSSSLASGFKFMWHSSTQCLNFCISQLMLTSCKMLTSANTGYTTVGGQTDSKKINSAGTSCGWRNKWDLFLPFLMMFSFIATFFSPPTSCPSYLSGFTYPHPVQ